MRLLLQTPTFINIYKIRGEDEILIGILNNCNASMPLTDFKI